MKRCIAVVDLIEILSQYGEQDIVVVDIIDQEEIEDILNSYSDCRFDSLDAVPRKQISTGIMESFTSEGKRLFDYSYEDIHTKCSDAWDDYMATHDVDSSNIFAFNESIPEVINPIPPLVDPVQVSQLDIEDYFLKFPERKRENPYFEVWDFTHTDGNGDHHRYGLYQIDFCKGGMHVYGTGVYLGNNIFNDPHVKMVQRVGYDDMQRPIFEDDIVCISFGDARQHYTLVEPKGVITLPCGNKTLIEWAANHVGDYIGLSYVGSIHNDAHLLSKE